MELEINHEHRTATVTLKGIAFISCAMVGKHKIRYGVYCSITVQTLMNSERERVY